MLDWRNSDGTLAAATHGKGVYTTLITSPLPVELSSFSGIFQNGKVKLLWRTETEVNNYGFEVDVPTLQDYAILDQNYPNPFNPETKIRFVINDNINVRLKVFDEIGSEIAEIFNDKVESGRIYEVNFNGSHLSSGVYFYSLISEKTRKTKKMLLIK
jgi:hypothetical protein